MLKKMHWYKIDLITLADVQNFCYLAENSGLKLKLTDDEDYMVNASSIMGVRYSLEWNKLYLVSEEDVYCIFKDYITEATVRLQ